MEFWVTIAALVALIVSYPYLRCFIKRLSLNRRLKSVCRKKGYLIHGTHPMWWLGSKRGSSCDFYIETPLNILSVKLFGMRQYIDTLVFTDDGKWLMRHFIAFASNYAMMFGIPFDGRKHKLTAYNFRHKFKMEWEIKSPRNLLLIHPTCREIIRRSGNAEAIMGAGDVVNGMEIYSLSRLIGLLDGGLE